MLTAANTEVEMRRITLMTTICLSAASTAGAQTTSLGSCVESSETGPRVGLYDLVEDGGRRLCVAPSEDADGTVVPCLRIGRVYVGQVRADVHRVLGDPWRRLGPREQRIATDVYLVFRDTVRDRGAYYVIEYEMAEGKEIAYSVQLTGDRSDSAHTFSCLALEDPEEAVRRQLGTPTDVTEFEFQDEAVRGVVWWFDPEPVSVEIAKARVYSIRVWRPDHVGPRPRTLRVLERQ